jgi:hypothetical protein
MVPNRGIGKERSDVFSLSHLSVAAHQDEMRALAASRRLARTRPARKPASGFRTAVRSVWSLLSGPADRPMTLPTLSNDPYRG